MSHAITASQAKQNFAGAVARAAHGPVRVMRHRKLVAGIVAPQWLEANAAVDERRAARAAQQQVEAQRLMRHQHLGIELLCADAAQQRKRIAAARSVVDRWERDNLCSADYIARWREWLALPVRSLVPLMCSNAQGWGAAMRQNSPFSALAAG
jgi:hypothetical protein